jgi:ATP-dependent Clp protease protease subunit
MAKRTGTKNPVIPPALMEQLKNELTKRVAADLGLDLSPSPEDDDSSSEVDSRAILMLSGEIGEQHRGIINNLLELHYNSSFNEPVTLLINSDGGDASVGWAIIDVMNFIRLPVNTVALGYACSMAADIFVNGDKRTMGEHATLMIHPHSSGAIGNHHSLIATQRGDMIEHTRRVNHYLSNSKYETEEEINATLLGVLGGDVYLTPQEVLEHGLCDEIALTSEDKRRKRHHLLPAGPKTPARKSKPRKSPSKKPTKRTG